MIVRQFNDNGMAEFRAFLAACRDAPSLPVAQGLLEDERLTQALKPTLEIEQRQLDTKADAASYLACVLAPLPENRVVDDAGLWTWLTLYFFDSVCPPRAGRRSVKNDYHYIFEPRNARHFYRHLLFISWQVLRIAGDHNRLFLGSPLSTLDKVTTEVMKRLFLTRIPCIFEVLDRLYWDAGRGRARTGIVGGSPIRPGDLTHRLPLRIRQLEKTYDLVSLSASQLIELLGDEFQRFMPPPPTKSKDTMSAASSEHGSRSARIPRISAGISTLAQLRKWIIETFPAGTQLAWLNGQWRGDILEISEEGLLVSTTGRMGRYLLKWRVIESTFEQLLSRGSVTPEAVGRDGIVVCSLLASLPGAERDPGGTGVKLQGTMPRSLQASDT